MKQTFMILALIGLLFLLSLPIFAQEIKVSSYVSSSEVPLGQSITLTVEIAGELNVSVPVVEIQDCRVQYYGPSTQVSIVNGKRTELIRHIFSIVPTKVGMMKIPVIEVIHKNQSYYTQAINVSVVKESSKGGDSLEDQIEDYVFLEIELGKKRVYVNEQIPLTINLYFHQNVELQNIHYPELDTANLLSEKFSKPERVMKVRHGQYYHVFPFETSIQPISSGRYELDAISLQTDLVVQRQNKRLNSFFQSNYDLVPLTITATSVELEVLDLPSEGKPEGFSGAVGRYNLEVSVTPEKVQLGEPLTIRSKIFGSGNFNTVTGSIIERVPQFKYYDQQTVQVSLDPTTTTAEREEKVFEQVIIPLERVQEIPKVSFSFFDPVEEKYHTIEQQGLSIQMTAEENLTSVVADYRQKPKTNQVFGQDILYIKNTLGRLVLSKQIISPRVRFSGVFFFVLFVAGLVMKWCLNRKKPLTKKRQQINAVTYKKLQNSETILKTGDKSSFYSLVYQIMQNFLKEYYQITITGISDYEAKHLLEAGLSREIVAKIEEFYQKIDAKRFADDNFDDDHEQILDQAKEIVKLIGEGGVA